MSSFATITAAASIGALAVAPLAPPPAPATPAASQTADVRLAADSIPLGAIPAAFIRNQLTFCGLICPSIAQLATSVPVGAALAPGAFVGGLHSGSLLQAIGTAAESVTGPADVATTGIITPDVFIVVPKAIGTTLPIVIVSAFDVAEALARPAQLGGTIQTGRANILAALDTPASTTPVELPSGAQGFVEVATVAAVNVADAVAFRAGELLISGAAHTANVSATTLATTGNVRSTLGAGAAAANAVLEQAGGIVSAAVDTAVTDVRASLHQPQALTARSARTAKPSPARHASTGPVASVVKSAAHNLRSALHGAGQGSGAGRHRA